MTLQTSNGISLARRASYLQRQLKWVNTLKKNSKKLTRLASLVRLAPGWERPTKDGNTLRLEYIGSAITPDQAKDDLKRIQKVLGYDPEQQSSMVRLGRISVELFIAFPWQQLRQAA